METNTYLDANFPEQNEVKLEPSRTKEDSFGIYFLRPLFDLDYSSGCSNPLCPKEMMYPVRQTHAPQMRTPLKRCGKCKQTCYCSAECQVTAWKNDHKDNCLFLRDLSKARNFILSLLLAPENSQYRSVVEKIIVQGSIVATFPTYKEYKEIISQPNYEPEPEPLVDAKTKKKARCIEDFIIDFQKKGVAPRKLSTEMFAHILDDDTMALFGVIGLIANAISPTHDTSAQILALLHATARANNQRKYGSHMFTAIQLSVDSISASYVDRSPLSIYTKDKQGEHGASFFLITMVPSGDDPLTHVTIDQVSEDVAVDVDDNAVLLFDELPEDKRPTFEEFLRERELARKEAEKKKVESRIRDQRNKIMNKYTRSIGVWTSPEGGFVVQRYGKYFNLVQSLFPSNPIEGYDHNSKYAKNMDPATLHQFLSRLNELADKSRSMKQRVKTYRELFAFGDNIPLTELPAFRFVTTRLLLAIV